MTMKQIVFLLKSLVVIVMMGWSVTSNAQKYEIDHDRVFFGEKMVMHADVRSFTDLGYGYAKDRNNVYMDGCVLENVEPSSFRLKERSTWRHRGHGEMDESTKAKRGYFKTKFNVYYGDKKIDASASSFKDIGNGYAKDAFNVYYYGEKLKGAWASSFVVLEGGYSKDSFTVYYYGNKVEGARASSFKYTGNGYAEDSFDAYYRGKKLQ